MGILTDLRDYFSAPKTETRAAERTAPQPPARTEISPHVSANEALSLAMVYRAINIHATSAKQLSIHAYKDDTELELTPAFIRQPDIKYTRSAWIEQNIVSLATNGNSYWKITRDNQGRVTNLKVLNPLEVMIDATADGDVVAFLYKDAKYRPEEIVHLSLMRVPGSVKGLSPIGAAQRELRGAIQTRDYASAWFDKSGVPNGILKSDQILSAEQAQQYKDAWNASAGAKNGVAVVGNGLTYSPVYLSPEDAQWLGVQNFNVTQIARLFGVPSSLMLADVTGTSMTYQNVEQDWIAYVRFSLMNYLLEIEQGLTQLLPGRTTAKFNIDALLRSDTLTRYNAHKIALEAGFMTLDEVRRLERLPVTDTTGLTPNGN